jgi:tetrapyrrole methylase family protein/MazG family protein
MTITILGLGPGDPRDLTRQAWDLLMAAEEVYLRTNKHPTIKALPGHLTVHSFDRVYNDANNFETVYETIADQVMALGRRPQGVLYAVPGHPLVGESSVLRLLERAQQERIEVCLINGLSFVEPTLSLLGVDALDGLQLVDATDLAAAHHPAVDPDRPLLLGQLDNQRLASEVKLTLMNAYPDDHLVTLIRGAGTPAAHAAAIPLYELDRSQAADHLTSLFVPSLPGVSSLPSFQETIAHLRAPDGCPWDREQTHTSLRANLLEETYEVLTAIDAGDPETLAEELGDLLMQVAMHVQIATEAGDFKFADVIRRIDAKLRRRHPHVFGGLSVEGTDEVLRNWEAIKAHERAAKGEMHRSRLDGVPRILPALARAQALADRAARDGFDWPDLDGVVDKIVEEIKELRSATSPRAIAREFGDLLFTIVNVARWLEVDAESALRLACDRFAQRYTRMEQMARARGTELGQLNLMGQEALWQESKTSETNDS